MTYSRNAFSALVAPLLVVAACDSGGLSTDEMEAAAQERVRESLELTEESALFTNVFVGEPVDGDTVLCGTVKGTTADGMPITPRRFIAATDPARWIWFNPADGNILPSQPDKFIEWHTTCAGEAAV
jgi:hypothetical protein